MFNKKNITILTFILLLISIVSSMFLVQANIYEPQAPNTLYWVDGDYNDGWEYAISIKQHGDYLYVSCQGTKNFLIFDISTRSNPTLAGNFTASERLREGSCSSNGNYFYVSYDGAEADDGGMMIINCTDKANPVEMGKVSPLSTTHIEGTWYVDALDVAFCADYDNDCIHSINCSDKSNPTVMDTQTGCGDKAHAIWANETIAVTVSYGGDTIVTFDVSDPENIPAALDSESSGVGRPASINGDDNPIMYVSNLDGSFNIFDISNPNSISQKSQTAADAVCTCVPNDDSDVLYVTTESGGYATIRAYNITNLASPTSIDTITNNNASYEVPTATSTCCDDIWIYLAVQDGKGVTTFRFGDEPDPEPEEKPQFLSIEENTNGTTIYNSTPTINWSVVGNTSQYWLQIDNNADFSSPEVNITDINQYNYPSNCNINATRVSFTLPTPLPSYNVYHMRVKAYTKI